MYTVWLCCGEFEQEDTREEAVGLAVAMMGGDGHTVLAVEGPGGEDLMAEVEAEERRRSREWLAARQASPEPIGKVEVAGPTGKWWGQEWVYSESQRDTELADQRAVYGDDRVRYVEGSPRR